MWLVPLHWLRIQHEEVKMTKLYTTQNKDELFETIARWCHADFVEGELVALDDALHTYFKKTNTRNWCDVHDEARRVAAHIFEPDVFEEDSPIDDLLSATAAQAADGVWQTFAEAFGLQQECVELVLATWNERIETTAISWEEFMIRYEAEKTEQEKEVRDLAAAMADNAQPVMTED
jgi:hypothetical protein